MLEILTFTGVDEATDLSALKDICSQYQQVEFAVLYGSHPGEGNPTFPSIGFIQEFRTLKGVRTAIHLCGPPRRAAPPGNWTAASRSGSYATASDACR